jgi:hypothetical protein
MRFDVAPAGIRGISDLVERALQIARRLEQRVIALGTELVLVSQDAEEQPSFAGRKLARAPTS